MKKIRLLIPIMAVVAPISAATTLVGCANDNTEKITATLYGSSTGVYIVNTALYKEKDSVILLNIPDRKQIKVNELVVKVGEKTLTKDAKDGYAINNNYINIKAKAMTGQNISLKVIVEDLPITAEIDSASTSGVSIQSKALNKGVESIIVLTLPQKHLIRTDKLVVKADDTVLTKDAVDGYKLNGTAIIISAAAMNTANLSKITLTVISEEEVTGLDITYKTNNETTDTIKDKNLEVKAKNGQTPQQTPLAFSTDYKVFNGETELLDFGTTGYAFEGETTQVELTIKYVGTYENKEQVSTKVKIYKKLSELYGTYLETYTTNVGKIEGESPQPKKQFNKVTFEDGDYVYPKGKTEETDKFVLTGKEFDVGYQNFATFGAGDNFICAVDIKNDQSTSVWEPYNAGFKWDGNLTLTLSKILNSVTKHVTQKASGQSVTTNYTITSNGNIDVQIKAGDELYYQVTINNLGYIVYEFSKEQISLGTAHMAKCKIHFNFK